MTASLLGAGIIVAALALGAVLVYLLRRVDPPLAEPTPMRTRHGTIPMVRCEECGELVERHRAILIGGGWYCRDPEQCPPGDVA